MDEGTLKTKAEDIVTSALNFLLQPDIAAHLRLDARVRFRTPAAHALRIITDYYRKHPTDTDRSRPNEQQD